jgi:integrase
MSSRIDGIAVETGYSNKERTMASIRKRTWRTKTGELRTGWLVDFVDAQGNRDRRQFEFKREADAFRIEIEGQIRAGTFRHEAGKITVKEVAERFLERCRGRMERGERMTRSSFQSYEGHVNLHILHPDHGIGDFKLAQLTARQVGLFRDRLRDAGVSVPTTRKILTTLYGLLKFAIGEDLVAVNAAQGVRVIGRRDEGSKKVTPPSKEAMKALLAAATPRFRIWLTFAAATGLRASEFHALRWRHVHFEKAEVRVETRVDRWREEDTTKSEAGIRTIPLGAGLVTTLKAWRLESAFSLDEDLVFPNGKGLYEHHETMSAYHFRPTRERAGVKGITWHSLRHFAISCWIERGLSPKVVQTFAGHKSLQVTMDRYGHLFPSEDHRVAMDAIASEMFA